MISTLKIRGFQVHKKLDLELDMVTTFVGETNVGKTAIIRSLVWLALAKPAGTRIINHGCDSVRVSAVVEGKRIAKRRGRNRPAQYRLDGKVFSAAGVTVPEEIRHALGLEEINFQRQLDPPLWMLESPGQLSKHLNKIVDLESIDKSLKLINSKVGQAKSTVKVCTQRIKDHKEKLKNLVWVEEMAEDHKTICGLREQLDNLTERRRNLCLSLGRVRTLRKQRRSLQRKATQATGLLNAARELHKATAELRERREEVIRKREELNHITKLFVVLDHYKQRLSEEQEKISKVKECPTCHRPMKSSPSSAETCTYHTTPLRRERRKGTSGMG